MKVYGRMDVNGRIGSYLNSVISSFICISRVLWQNRITQSVYVRNISWFYLFINKVMYKITNTVALEEI